MEVGAVTFHNSKNVMRIKVKKDREAIKKIMKTKSERNPNFELELKEHMDAVEATKNQEVREERQAVKEELRAAKSVHQAKKNEWNDFFAQ